jgi:hypothetical protein
LLDSNSIATAHCALVNFAYNHDDAEPAAASEETASIEHKSESDNFYSEPFDTEVLSWGFSPCKKDKKKGKKKVSAESFEDGPIEEAYLNYAEHEEAIASQSKMSKLWHKFKGRVYHTRLLDFQSWRNRKSCENCTGAFLCHA